jgi:hypothetical protein
VSIDLVADDRLGRETGRVGVRDKGRLGRLSDPAGGNVSEVHDLLPEALARVAMKVSKRRCRCSRYDKPDAYRSCSLIVAATAVLHSIRLEAPRVEFFRQMRTFVALSHLTPRTSAVPLSVSRT